MIRCNWVSSSAGSPVRRGTVMPVRGLCDSKVFLFAVFGVCVLSGLIVRRAGEGYVYLMCV